MNNAVPFLHRFRVWTVAWNRTRKLNYYFMSLQICVFRGSWVRAKRDNNVNLIYCFCFRLSIILNIWRITTCLQARYRTSAFLSRTADFPTNSFTSCKLSFSAAIVLWVAFVQMSKKGKIRAAACNSATAWKLVVFVIENCLNLFMFGVWRRRKKFSVYLRCVRVAAGSGLSLAPPLSIYLQLK